MPPDPTPDDATPTGDEPTQAMQVFTEATEPDVPLDPATPAFDRVQDEVARDAEVAAENERAYNRRYVDAHGDHHGHAPKDES